MPLNRRVAWIPLALLSLGLLLGDVHSLDAQPKGNVPASQSPGSPIVIQREPAVLIAPKIYQVPLTLEPIKHLQLAAATDGIVQRLRCQEGDKLEAEAEAVRMEDKELQLIVEAAKANHRAAEIELRRAKTGMDADAVEIAEAKVQAAKAELDLAETRLGRAIIRAPFAGVVQRVLVQPGQFIGAGEPLVELADTSKLRLEIPVDRRDENSQTGKTVSLRIEDETVEAAIQTIYPPAEKFHPLRDLVDSVASAIVTVDNPAGKYPVGQTVHSPLIPRQPVCEVSKTSLHTQSDGKWKLQVIRKNVVHDLTVSTLGRVGEDRLYVTGPFAEGDEVIIKSSQELTDGTQVIQGSTGKNQPATRPGGRGRLPGEDEDPS